MTRRGDGKHGLQAVGLQHCIGPGLQLGLAGGCEPLLDPSRQGAETARQQPRQDPRLPLKPAHQPALLHQLLVPLLDTFLQQGVYLVEVVDVRQ